MRINKWCVSNSFLCSAVLFVSSVGSAVPGASAGIPDQIRMHFTATNTDTIVEFDVSDHSNRGGFGSSLSSIDSFTSKKTSFVVKDNSKNFEFFSNLEDVNELWYQASKPASDYKMILAVFLNDNDEQVDKGKYAPITDFSYTLLTSLKIPGLETIQADLDTDSKFCHLLFDPYEGAKPGEMMKEGLINPALGLNVTLKSTLGTSISYRVNRICIMNTNILMKDTKRGVSFFIHKSPMANNALPSKNLEDGDLQLKFRFSKDGWDGNTQLLKIKWDESTMIDHGFSWNPHASENWMIMEEILQALYASYPACEEVFIRPCHETQAFYEDLVKKGDWKMIEQKITDDFIAISKNLEIEEEICTIGDYNFGEFEGATDLIRLEHQIMQRSMDKIVQSIKLRNSTEFMVEVKYLVQLIHQHARNTLKVFQSIGKLFYDTSVMTELQIKVENKLAFNKM